MSCPALWGLAGLLPPSACESYARSVVPRLSTGIPHRSAPTATCLSELVPLSLLLGTFFPLGMRLIAPLADTLTPWMWGVNGACGVLAGAVAVAVSMWLGIDMNLKLAAICYALLTLPALLLRGALARAVSR